MHELLTQNHVVHRYFHLQLTKSRKKIFLIKQRGNIPSQPEWIRFRSKKSISKDKVACFGSP